MKRVIELLRVSTAGQAAEDKASIPTQRSINRQTALAYGLTIVKSIELADVSGAQVLLAPEIQEMLRLMNDTEIHGVVVREFSRLMRPENFSDYALLQAFVDSETWLYLPDGPINFASNDGFLMGTLKAAMGGVERRELVKKMWNIKEEKRRNGGFSQSRACLPFGVSYEKNGWLYTTGAEQVREAFSLVLAGHTSYEQLSRAVGIRAVNLRNILRNPIYTGWRVIDKRRDPSPRAKKARKDGRQGDRPKIKRAAHEVIKVQVIKEPLISESDFNKVQRILEAKRERHWRMKEDEHHRWTYNGFLDCTCGALVYTKYRRDDYYVCSRRCGASYQRRDRLELQLDSLFTRRLTSPRFLRSILMALRKENAPQVNVERIQSQIESLTAKRQRILDSYFEGVINGTERDVRIAEAEREKTVLTGLLAKTRPRQDLDAKKLAEVFAVFTGFDLLNREDKRRLLNTITPSITVANYEIKGMFIGLDKNHVGLDYEGNDRVWLPLAA